MKEIAPILFLIAAIVAGLAGPLVSWKIARRSSRITEPHAPAPPGAAALRDRITDLPDLYYPVVPAYW